MANEFEIVIKLDDGSIVNGFAKIENQAKSTAQSAENSLGGAFKSVKNSVTDIAAGFFLLQQALGAALAAFRLPIELIKLNDQANQAVNSFKTLADQAGVSAQRLTSEFEASAGGLVDTEDILKASGTALIELGQNATKLPQLFSIARQASAAFGVDTLQAYESITNAIVSGQTKQLKSIGIIIDSEIAYNSYAVSIGKTAEQLTLAEKQQAILNATLQKGTEALGDVTKNEGSLTVTIQKLSVAWGDFKEAILSSDSAIGQTLIKMAEMATYIIKFNTSKATLESTLNPGNAKEKIALVSEELKKVNAQLEAARIQFATEDVPQTDVLMLTARAKSLNDELINAQVLYQTTLTQESINAENIKATNLEKEKSLLHTKALAEEELKLAQIKKDADAEEAAQKKRQQDAYVALGNSIKNSLVNGVVSSMAAVGGALASGKNAGEEFTNSWKKTLGGLAVMVGQTMILIGLGMSELAPILGFKGAGAVAAGTALVILGGALQASGGGSTGNATSQSTAGSGGGITTTDNLSTEFTKPESLNRAEPTTQVAVNINGDVLDSEESGLRIVDLLNKAFDKSGVQVRQGAFA